MLIVADMSMILRLLLMSERFLFIINRLRIPRRKSPLMCRSWTSSIIMTLYVARFGSLLKSGWRMRRRRRVRDILSQLSGYLPGELT